MVKYVGYHTPPLILVRYDVKNVKTGSSLKPPTRIAGEVVWVILLNGDSVYA